MLKNLLSAKDYTDQRIFEQEQIKIFSNTWHYCGLVEDIPKPFDYITVQAGNNNIVVYKDENEEINAFHNICRHRGMQLLEGEGKLNRVISCPYHDWTYSRNGELKSLPKHKQEFASVDKSCLSLKGAKAGVWRGMIWVHPDPKAQEVQTFFEPMAGYLAPYAVESLSEAKENTIEEVIHANWKLVVENYIDHYHLAQLHAGTLNMYEHGSAEFGFSGDHFHFWEPLTADYQNQIEDNAPYPLLIDKTHPNIGAWVPMLFPCTGLAETESSWSVFHITPLAVDKTRVRIRSKLKACSTLQYMKQAAKSYNYWQKKVKGKYSGLLPDHPLGSGDFMKEDIYVCEQLQKNLLSAYFEFGPSAIEGESPIREFQRRVLAKLAD